MTKVSINKEKIYSLLNRGVKEVLVKNSLEKRLMSGKKLRVKLGIDPTGSVLHLGHAVILKKLREFQEMGHQVILLIGDFTARIGDPTGRVSARKVMTNEDIQHNMRTYKKQAGLILNMKEVEVRHNSEWLDKLNLEDFILLASKITYAQMAQRADFKERIKNDIDLSMQEFMYPAMQGYDSVALRADVELGGTDQKFNLLMGRQLQKRYSQIPQDIITCPLLEGLSGGDKMSKSLNNYVALTDKVEDMYGKIMSLADNLILRYFELCTTSSKNELDKISVRLEDDKVNPRDIKMQLASEIASIYHGKKSAETAEEQFIKTFQKKEAPDEVANYELRVSNINIIELLAETGLVISKGEARRLIKQNGIKVNGKLVGDINQEVEITKDGVLLQRGKRRFIKVICKK